MHHHGPSCAHSPHHHSHAPLNSFHKAFAFGIGLNGLFIAVELTAGYAANSLALIADAIHNLGDVAGLLLAWGGYALGFRKPDNRFTFGLGRVSIIATVLNGAILVVSSLGILLAAFGRLQAPVSPEPWTIALVALMGIVINGGTAWLLARGQDDINIKGAMLHMAADAAVSGGVVLSAGVIFLTGWAWIDPLLSAGIALLVIWSAWPLLREGLNLSVDGVPAHTKPEAVRDFLTAHPDLAGVHDLHIWALSTTKTALSAHLVPRTDADPEKLLHQIQAELKKTFGLSHITLQFEKDHAQCDDCEH